MAETFEDAIREIKQRADIGAVIGRSVKLKRSGRSLVGLCPFHNEKTPSFYVHPSDGFFKCFGCDAKGDVFSFLERHTGQSFIDIARNLADEVGVEIPDDRRSPADKERAQERDRAMRAADLSQRYFRQCLRTPEGKPGLHYLKEVRGLSDEDIDRWAIGYGGTTPDGLMNFLKKEGVSLVDARNAGVVASGKHGDYSFYRSRVTFPIRNRAGKVLAFGGRALGDRGPKYVNGPQSLIYDKSRDLYGLFEALPEMRKGKAGVLVEGYFDVVALGRAGYAAGLSPCGTALTSRHIQTISRYTDRVVLCLDSDAAGMKGTERALLLLLQAGMKVSLAELLHKDPDDYVKADKAGELLRTIEAAKDAFEALVDRAVDKAAGSPQRRLRAVEALLPFLAAPKDALTKSHYLRYVADNLRAEIDVLRAAVAERGQKALQKQMRGTGASPSRPPPPRPAPNAQAPQKRPPATPERKPDPRPRAPSTQAAPTSAKAGASANAPAGGRPKSPGMPSRDRFDGDDLPDLTEPSEDTFNEAWLREARDDELVDERPTESERPPNKKPASAQTPEPAAPTRSDPPRSSGESSSTSEANDRFDDEDDGDSDGFENGRSYRESKAKRREPATWRTAEKAIARALLCHPHLAHKAAILVPALRNWELSSFISQLDHLIIANSDRPPHEALTQVQIPDWGTFPQLLREIFVARGKNAADAFMTEDAAVRFIEDFVQTLDEVEVRRALGEVQRAMRSADERQDLDSWRRLQAQQKELVRLLQDVSMGLDSAPPPPPTPAQVSAKPSAPALGPKSDEPSAQDPPPTAAPATPSPLKALAQPAPPEANVVADDEDELDEEELFDF